MGMEICKVENTRFEIFQNQKILMIFINHIIYSLYTNHIYIHPYDNYFSTNLTII